MFLLSGAPANSVSNRLVTLAILGLLISVAVFVAVAYKFRRRLDIFIASLNDYFSPESEFVSNPNWSLLGISFVGLYVEIMIIRWIGTEVRVFAYFQNLALITCFLGFGLGCYWANRRKTLALSLLAITTLSVLVALPFSLWQGILYMLSALLSLSPDAILWGSLPAVRSLGLTPLNLTLLSIASVIVVAIFLLLLLAAMIPLGQYVGYYLDRAPNPITAYTANLIGSVAGIWIFAGIAFLWLPPSYWFALAFLLMSLLPRFSRRISVVAVVALAIVVLVSEYGHDPRTQTYWSPYQKLDLISEGSGQYSVKVNNTGYLTIRNMTSSFLRTHPLIARRFQSGNSYDTPFGFARNIDRVLILGAGAGNDAAGALRAGTKYVDAVEIDPVILSIGKRLHPEKPYDSSRVHTVLTDARAFLRETSQKYDVIVFGFLDSHVEFSNFSNMRIDNYVYTEESLSEARRLLKPGGILIVKFTVRPPWTWMGQRFYAMLDAIFHRPPVTFDLIGGTVFIESDDPELWTRAASRDLAAIVSENPPSFPLEQAGAPSPASDDWPYIYYREHSIPRTYLTVSVILLLMAVFLVRGTLQPREPSTWQFFFLGSGFLLLETQLVSRLALYFGTTWLVNCVALTAILFVLVLANAYVAKRKPKRLDVYYGLLLLCLFANYFFPWESLPYGARTIGILLSAGYTAPVFFAGVIFTEAFRRHEGKSYAFGANIVGAVAGGLAQNLSFLFGMKALLLFAAVFYASAALSGLILVRHSVSIPSAVNT